MGLGKLEATQSLPSLADPLGAVRYADLSDARLKEAARSLTPIHAGAIPSTASTMSAKK